MNTNALAIHSAQPTREWKNCLPLRNGLVVSASASVNADRHRIYQALTVPEYIETWFLAPGAIEGRTTASAAQNSFRISYWATPREQFRVLCSYQVLRRSKLVFAWQQVAPSEGTSSMVKIRLLGDFERTTVDLTHAGLTPSNREWHQALWTMSLQRLSKLF